MILHVEINNEERLIFSLLIIDRNFDWIGCLLTLKIP